MTVCGGAPHLASGWMRVQGGDHRNLATLALPDGSLSNDVRDDAASFRTEQHRVGSGHLYIVWRRIGEPDARLRNHWLYRASGAIICGKFQKMHFTMPSMMWQRLFAAPQLTHRAAERDDALVPATLHLDHVRKDVSAR